jgi:hypothetical protein
VSPDGEPILYGVPLPFPPTAESTPDRQTTRDCAALLEGILYKAFPPERVATQLPRDEVRCLAARLYLRCTERLQEAYATEKAKLLSMDKAEEKRHSATRRVAHSFAKEQCGDVWISRDQDAVFEYADSTLKAVKTWETLLKEWSQ